jgi:hypothetical protein
MNPEDMIRILDFMGLSKIPLFRARIDTALRTGDFSELQYFFERKGDTLSKILIDYQNQKLDPFNPRPVTQEFPGTVPFGWIPDPATNEPAAMFNIEPEDLFQHTAIFGGIGFGKTNTVILLATIIWALFRKQVIFWIFEPKGTYSPYFHPDFVTLEFTDFIDQAFYPPTNKILSPKWAHQVIQLMGTHLYFQVGSKSIVDRAVESVREKYKTDYPTHAEIYQTLKGFQENAKKSGQPESSAISTALLRFEQLDRFDRNSKPNLIPFRELARQNIIFEWGNETAEMRIYRTALLLTKLYMFKKHEKVDLYHIVIMEEARGNLAPRDNTFGEPVLETIATLCREFEIGLVFITQEPSSIARVFKANAATTIALPMSEGEETLSIKRSFNLTPEQYDYYLKLPGLGPGNALARYARLGRVFPVRFAKAVDGRKKISDAELEQRRNEFLKRFTIPQQQTIEMDEPQPQGMPDDWLKMLKALANVPFLKVTDLGPACGMHPNRCNEVRDELRRNGYIEHHSIRINKRGQAPAFSEITDKGYRALGIKSPAHGREGFAHRLFKHQVAKRLESDGWTVQVEAPAPGQGERYDLLATKDDECVAYEMTIHTHNVSDNIMKGKLDKRITGMVFVTMTKKEADNLTHEHGNDIDFQPIWKFTEV